MYLRREAIGRVKPELEQSDPDRHLRKNFIIRYLKIISNSVDSFPFKSILRDRMFVSVQQRPSLLLELFKLCLLEIKVITFKKWTSS